LIDCQKCAGRTGKNLLIEDETVEEQINIGNSVFDEGDEGNILYRDGNETLVARKSLLTPKDDFEEDWLRSNIFHMACTIVEQVCMLIIDNGSCEKVVSEEAIKKLQLKIDRHPKPYKLSWLKKGSDVTVDKRCLVSFSIGRKYFDNAWCDVVSMDACHLLLGRPWQYDQSGIYDG
jgi:hypothetical protein